MDFIDWNNKLAQYFFNEETEGREVILNINKKIIEEIGPNTNGLDSFIDSLKQGASWTTYSGLCMKAYQSFENWRKRDFKYPPYIAYLCLFVLANELDGDFSPNAYYPKLNKLLGFDEEAGMLPSFDKMIALWSDLETWSKEDKNEDLGSFTARIRGGNIHIGLPLSQTILTSEDRKNLPYFFDKANFEPGQFVSSDILLNNLKVYGRDYFSLRTRKLFISGNNEFKELKNALIQLLQDEIIFWNGTIQVIDQNSDISIKTRLGIRICLNIEPLSGNITSRLRLKFNKAIPHSDFSFHLKKISNINLSCQESNSEWSTPIVETNSKKTLSAFDLDWDETCYFTDNEDEWSTRLTGKKIRLFKKGKLENLQDQWIETLQNLQSNAEFLVVCNGKLKEKITSWIKCSCEGLIDSRVLPNGWYLFHTKNARSSFEETESLSISSDLNVRFKGGFKLGRGNKFFDFVLPKIELENAKDEKIKVVGENFEKELNKIDENGNIWTFPKDIPTGEKLKLEVLDSNDEQVELRRNYNIMVVSESFLSIGDPQPPRRLPDGGIDDTHLSTQEYVKGAEICMEEEIQNSFDFLPLHLGNKIVLIGQNVGEVTKFPNETISDKWFPVWMLAKQNRKHWLVYFCGSDLDTYPKVKSSTNDSKSKKKWKKFLWVNRKIHDTHLLNLTPVKKLWEAYQGVAKKL